MNRFRIIIIIHTYFRLRILRIVNLGSIVPIFRFLSLRVWDGLGGQEVPVLLERTLLLFLVVNLYHVRVVRAYNERVQMGELIVLCGVVCVYTLVSVCVCVCVCDWTVDNISWRSLLNIIHNCSECYGQCYVLYWHTMGTQYLLLTIVKATSRKLYIVQLKQAIFTRE